MDVLHFEITTGDSDYYAIEQSGESQGHRAGNRHFIVNIRFQNAPR